MLDRLFLVIEIIFEGIPFLNKLPFLCWPKMQWKNFIKVVEYILNSITSFAKGHFCVSVYNP